MAAKVLIEHEGALYRGFARAYPEEIWDHGAQEWKPYRGEVPKGVDWGTVISEEDGVLLMAT